MTPKDLLDLEQAARTIVFVIERNRVSDELAEERRSAFHFISENSNSSAIISPIRSLSKEKPAADATGKNDGILKFTTKEIQEMPDLYAKMFKAGVAVAHVRKQHNGSFELRCQIHGKKISATAKSLPEAKKKFIKKLIEKQVNRTSDTPLFEEYAEKWLEIIKKPTIKKPTYDD